MSHLLCSPLDGGSVNTLSFRLRAFVSWGSARFIADAAVHATGAMYMSA